MNETLRKNRIRVLEKLMTLGYNDDKKISNLKLEELILIQSFNRSDLEIAVGLKNAVNSKSIITFLSGLEGRKNNYEEGK